MGSLKMVLKYVEDITCVYIQQHVRCIQFLKVKIVYPGIWVLQTSAITNEDTGTCTSILILISILISTTRAFFEYAFYECKGIRSFEAMTASEYCFINYALCN